MSDVLVHNVDESVIEGLKARARGTGRPLQDELKLILEQAAQPQHARPTMAEYRALAEQVRAALGNRPQSDSTELLAEDRVR
jgi:plasmid stability protein